MRHLLPLLFVVSLVGCSAAPIANTPKEPTYDIDVTCEKRFFANPESNEDGMTQLACGVPEMFLIWCPTNTVQLIGTTYLCTTQDGKSVRIQIR